jgi:uncharacterized protein
MLQQIGHLLICTYQKYISKLTPALCNFEITCSQYCRSAISKHGILHGGILTIRYMKQCAKEGKSLRLIKVTKKHYFPGHQAPTKLPQISKKEYFGFFFTVVMYSLIVPLIPLLIVNYDLGFSLVLGCVYLVLLLLGLFLKYFNRKLKIIKSVLMLVLLPPVAISFPSMLIASMFNSWLEPNDIEQRLGIDYKGYKIVTSIILGLCGVGLMFITPIVGAVLALAGYLVSYELDGLANGRINNLLGVFCLTIGCFAFYFSPIFALPAILLWWESNKTIRN